MLLEDKSASHTVHSSFLRNVLHGVNYLQWFLTWFKLISTATSARTGSSIQYFTNLQIPQPSSLELVLKHLFLFKTKRPHLPSSLFQHVGGGVHMKMPLYVIKHTAFKHLEVLACIISPGIS